MDLSLIINQEIIDRVIFLVINIIPIIVLGVIAGNILSELGYLEKVSIISKPITKYANLPKESGASITAILASPSASYSLLANYQEQGRINEKETIITTFTNTFFLYIRHIPTYYLPVVVPILGLKTGLIYIGTRLFISFTSTVTGIIIGYFFLSHNIKKQEKAPDIKKENTSNKNYKEKIENGLKNSKPILKKIIPRLMIIYTLVAIAVSNNFFEPIGNIVGPVTNHIGIPGEATTIIVARFADVSSSFVLAGELLNKKIVDSVQAITALLIGSVLSLSSHFIKNSLPNKIAYFGSKLGTKIAFYNLILSVSTVILAIYLLNLLAL